MFGSFSMARARLQSLAKQAQPLSDFRHNPSKPVILALKVHHYRAFGPLPSILNRVHWVL